MQKPARISHGRAQPTALTVSVERITSGTSMVTNATYLLIHPVERARSP